MNSREETESDLNSDSQDASNSEEVGTEAGSLVEQDNHNQQIIDPMEMDFVLRLMFEFCPVTTLKNCRLVCKRWNSLSLQTWRHRAVLCASKKLEDGSSVKEHLQLMQDDESLQLQDYPFRNLRFGYGFPEAILLTSLAPARHVTLQDINGGLLDFEAQPIMNLEMLLSAFPSLQVLKLNNCEWKWEEGTPLSTSLKRLNICRTVDSGNAGLESFQFIDWFPNMEALSLEYRPKFASESYMRKLERFARYISYQSEENAISWKELELIYIPVQSFSEFWNDANNNLNMKFLEPISGWKLHLKRFVIELRWGGSIKMKDVVGPLLCLLGHSKDSIQYLKINFPFHIDQFISLNFDERQRDYRFITSLTPVQGMNIKMDKLKEVNLANGIWGFFLLGHLELPNMKKLSVKYGKSSGKVNLQQYQLGCLKEKVYPKLESLKLFDEIPLPETVATFTNMSVPLDKHAFEVVCERFRGLKTLNVLTAECRYAVLDDESLTGIAKEAGEGALRHPNITNLTLLTSLSISKSAFTDFSVINGFLLLPKLHSLKVTFYKISEEAKEKLMEHVTGSLEIEVVGTFND